MISKNVPSCEGALLQLCRRCFQRSNFICGNPHGRKQVQDMSPHPRCVRQASFPKHVYNDSSRLPVYARLKCSLVAVSVRCYPPQVRFQPAQDGIFHVELKYTTQHGAQLIEADGAPRVFCRLVANDWGSKQAQPYKGPFVLLCDQGSILRMDPYVFLFGLGSNGICGLQFVSGSWGAMD